MFQIYNILNKIIKCNMFYIFASVSSSTNDPSSSVAAGTVITIAGNGNGGFKDGACDQAQFNNPCGVAVAADGAVIVADECNHRVRQINGDQ